MKSLRKLSTLKNTRVNFAAVMSLESARSAMFTAFASFAATLADKGAVIFVTLNRAECKYTALFLRLKTH
jgi:hypothetical protein